MNYFLGVGVWYWFCFWQKCVEFHHGRAGNTALPKGRIQWWSFFQIGPVGLLGTAWRFFDSQLLLQVWETQPRPEAMQPLSSSPLLLRRVSAGRLEATQISLFLSVVSINEQFFFGAWCYKKILGSIGCFLQFKLYLNTCVEQYSRM